MVYPETAASDRGPAGAVRRVSRFGDFELSSPPSRLTRDGEPVHLRPQVMRALTELVERPGEVVTRQHLRQTIWRDVEHVEVDRGIKTVVRELRRALGDDPKNPRYIETIRGVGYRFVAAGSVETESLVKVVPRQKQRLRRAWIAAAAVVVVMSLLAIWSVWLSPNRPTLLVPSLRPLDGATELTVISERLNDQLSQELVNRFSTDVDLVHVRAGAGEERALSPSIARYAVDGELSSGQVEDSYYISLELIDRSDGRIVWIGTYDLSAGDIEAWPTTASRELIEAVLAQP